MIPLLRAASIPRTWPLALFFLLVLCGANTKAVDIYSSNPDHLWNRVYAAFFIRTDSTGITYDDLLDPPLWIRTEYLLEGESNRRAAALLREFNQDDAALRGMSPLQRALMQRDLLAVFFWLTGDHIKPRGGLRPKTKEQRELAELLAGAIRKTALTAETIRKLPDNYAAAVSASGVPSEFDPQKPDQPILPKDLLDDLGPWIALEPQGDDWLPATVHFKAFSGRSAFEVRLRHPKGRAAAEAYLKELASLRKPWFDEKPSHPVPGAFGNDETGPWINPYTPQFPPGTAWALVRRAILADIHGEPVLSPIVESVQLRVYLRTPPDGQTLLSSGREAQSQIDQQFIEWELDRRALFGKGGFHLATPGGPQRFSHFMSKGFDPFEEGWPLRAPQPAATLECFTCHNAKGIFSVLSRSRAFEGESLRIPEFHSVTKERIAQITELEANRSADWTLLRWVLNPEKEVH